MPPSGESLPVRLVKLALWLIAHSLYKIDVLGAEKVPDRGPALLVANHVSFADALLIGAAARRPVRFLMYRPYYEHWLLHPLFRMMGAIPIADGDTPRRILGSLLAARSALEAGDAVCIFAEGSITRTGNMLKFKRGFERIIEGLDAPIVPVHLGGVWGSIFSFSGGRFLWKTPRRLPYPVTVGFGAPLPPGADAAGVRRAIQELGSEAFARRLADRAPLPIEFARSARRRWFGPALADSFGQRLSGGQALTAALLLSRSLARVIPEERAAVLLPPSVGGALANVALSMAGKVTVNLDYSLPQEEALAAARRAGARAVVTSRRFARTLGWNLPEPVYLEDALARLSLPAAALLYCVLPLAPFFLLERTALRRARKPLDALATVIFTSDSPGPAKGVMLSHANILSNIEALAQLFDVSPADKVLGVLPFHDASGFTGTLWFPLVSGAGAVYGPGPLDARASGALAEEHRATILPATPAFLEACLSRVEPGRFSSLRHVFAVAGTLRPELAEAFEARFGPRPLEGYGSAELSPVGAVNVPDFRRQGVRQRGRKPGTLGHPLPGVTMKVVDPESGVPRPPGESGLLLVKGPNVMLGYLGDEARTRAALKDGWFATGDVALIDDEGFVRIADRAALPEAREEGAA